MYQLGGGGSYGFHCLHIVVHSLSLSLSLSTHTCFMHVFFYSSSLLNMLHPSIHPLSLSFSLSLSLSAHTHYLMHFFTPLSVQTLIYLMHLPFSLCTVSPSLFLYMCLCASERAFACICTSIYGSFPLCILFRHDYRFYLVEFHSQTNHVIGTL